MADDPIVEPTEKESLLALINPKLDDVDAMLLLLRSISDRLSAAQLGGGREVALALTNIEQGKLWLAHAVTKM